MRCYHPIYLQYDVIKAPSVQTWLVSCFLSVQTFSSNFCRGLVWRILSFVTKYKLVHFYRFWLLCHQKGDFYWTLRRFVKSQLVKRQFVNRQLVKSLIRVSIRQIGIKKVSSSSTTEKASIRQVLWKNKIHHDMILLPKYSLYFCSLWLCIFNWPKISPLKIFKMLQNAWIPGNRVTCLCIQNYRFIQQKLGII